MAVSFRLPFEFMASPKGNGPRLEAVQDQGNPWRGRSKLLSALRLAKIHCLYDKSAKDKSANDTSAKPTVRMPTVRKGSTVRRDKSANVNSANASSAMRHRCEKSATAVRMTTVRKRHCAVTCFTGKSPSSGRSSSGIVKGTFLPLCKATPSKFFVSRPARAWLWQKNRKQNKKITCTFQSLRPAGYSVVCEPEVHALPPAQLHATTVRQMQLEGRQVCALV